MLDGIRLTCLVNFKKALRWRNNITYGRCQWWLRQLKAPVITQWEPVISFLEPGCYPSSVVLFRDKELQEFHAQGYGTLFNVCCIWKNALRSCQTRCLLFESNCLYSCSLMLDASVKKAQITMKKGTKM